MEPGAPELAGGIPRDDEQVATIVFATLAVSKWMMSEANQEQIGAAGLSFILGMKIPHVPYAVAQWWREHLARRCPPHWPLPDIGCQGRCRVKSPL